MNLWKEVSPWDKLKAVYVERCPERSMSLDMLDFARHGYLHATPTSILMAKPIPFPCLDEDAMDTKKYFERWMCEAWYVWAYAGDELWEAARYIPYKLPYFAWHRRGGIKYYDFDHWLKRCSVTTSAIPSFPP